MLRKSFKLSLVLERRAAERRYPMFKDKSGDREDIPHVQGMERRPEEKSHVQGKEQWLRDAAAAVKRYHTFKLSETN